MKHLSFLVILASLIISSASLADGHKTIEEVWDCKLQEGKTLEEAYAMNQTWITFVNGAVKSSGIGSRMAMPIVGDIGHFYYIDTFPNLDAWGQMKAAMQTDEGRKLEAQLDALSECRSNRLYEVRK